MIHPDKTGGKTARPCYHDAMTEDRLCWDVAGRASPAADGRKLLGSRSGTHKVEFSLRHTKRHDARSPQQTRVKPGVYIQASGSVEPWSINSSTACQDPLAAAVQLRRANLRILRCTPSRVLPATYRCILLARSVAGITRHSQGQVRLLMAYCLPLTRPRGRRPTQAVLDARRRNETHHPTPAIKAPGRFHSSPTTIVIIELHRDRGIRNIGSGSVAREDWFCTLSWADAVDIVFASRFLETMHCIIVVARVLEVHRSGLHFRALIWRRESA
ncbi:hypothetical protein FKP32DRAFT_146265 [Trametes sanguinea]|nr:hypothetical protein FKP32DRAFT_146265 [Trametes sanguinea]